MTNIPYTCPICGKVLKVGHRGAIGLHERSQLHKDAVNKAQNTKQIEDEVEVKIKDNIQIKTEPKPVINTEIRTTNMENINDTIKTKGSDESDGSDEWDGYLV